MKSFLSLLESPANNISDLHPAHLPFFPLIQLFSLLWIVMNSIWQLPVLGVSKDPYHKKSHGAGNAHCSDPSHGRKKGPKALRVGDKTSLFTLLR